MLLVFSEIVSVDSALQQGESTSGTTEEDAVPRKIGAGFRHHTDMHYDFRMGGFSEFDQE